MNITAYYFKLGVTTFVNMFESKMVQRPIAMLLMLLFASLSTVNRFNSCRCGFCQESRDLYFCEFLL